MNTIIVGERYRPILEKPLINSGFSPCWMPNNPALDPRVAGHADLSIFVGKHGAVISQHLYDSSFVNNFTKKGIPVFRALPQASQYPQDASLCALELNNTLYHNEKATDPALGVLYPRRVHTAQGYARCSTCVISDSAAITGDPGMAHILRSGGVTVLEIHPGRFLLDGFREGFIGGSTFVYSNCVYFTGTLAQHPDRSQILTFLQAHGKRWKFLTDRPAFDIGSAIVL